MALLFYCNNLPATVVPSPYQVRITFEVGKSTDICFEAESLVLATLPAASEKSREEILSLSG
ncbi:MAG: hypothetical protein IKU01_06575 [Bacteroidales bacterium]|nr:hypothetical protein [Bacteroidales bacterium]